MGRGAGKPEKDIQVKIVRFLPKAEQDAVHAAYWYFDQEKGLAEEFQSNIAEAIELIQKNPKAFPYYEKPLRKKNLSRFPYSIYYLVEPDRIVINAILHFERNRWQILKSRM